MLLIIKQTLTASLALSAVTALGVWIAIPPWRGNLADYSASARIVDRNGRLLRQTLGKDAVWCDPIPLAQTSEWTAKALIAGEDKRFYQHHGVDGIAVCRAAVCNVVYRRIVSGASTISMLVAKLTEPRPRTFWTKIVEAQHATHLESQLSKEDLLEAYLNRAPFGANIVGIETASRFYLGKSAKDLTLSEAALLVGIPQSPARLRPDQHLDRALKRRDYILRQMRACNFITQQQYDTARAQEPAVNKQPAPFRAPHFCDAILKRYPHERELKTTLNLDLQTVAEHALRTRTDELRGDGISGGGIVIIDVKNRCVRALVGSPDYQNKDQQGEVNTVLSRRSPGSALKPFIYAMALEEGMCSPHTVVADVPTDFAGYKPENFSREYSGPVTVRHALVQSLNIPALIYANRIGLENVVRCLRQTGISTLDQPPEHYGLSIAIGSCEVTLLDLANAYACLARKGIYSDVAFLANEPHAKDVRLFSEETTYLIADILSGDERAFDATGHTADVRQPRVAWKTGTSTGNRDAWCVAYNPEYVVGVWLGNPRGTSSKALIGSSAATPLACALFRQLYPDGQSPWFERPHGLRTRQVCATSGMVPSSCCPETITDDVIPGITASTECTAHPLSKAGVMPKDGRNTTSDDRSTPIHITSPGRNETFRFVDDMPHLKQEVSLRALASASATNLYWFVDRQLYCRANTGTDIRWPLQKGRHMISCSDGQASADCVEIVVE